MYSCDEEELGGVVSMSPDKARERGYVGGGRQNRRRDIRAMREKQE